MPGLATAWRRIDDRTVELALRPGVKFHDGSTMTAEDVAFSFGPERMFGPSAKTPADIARPSPAATGPRSTGSRSSDANTVRFVNRTPDVTMEGRLSAGGSEVIQRAGFEKAASWMDYARRPIGTGPYRVVDFRPDTSLTLEAHDEYWGGRPPLARIRFLEVPETASRVNGLLSGEYEPRRRPAARPDRDGRGQSALRRAGRARAQPPHRRLRQAPPRARRSRACGWRWRMRSMGRRSSMRSGPGARRVPPGLQWEFYGPMFVEGWTVPPYRPGARAKPCCNDAGYKGEPIPYRIRNDYYTAEIATAQVLVEMWRAVGLNVELEVQRELDARCSTPSRPRGAARLVQQRGVRRPGLLASSTSTGPHGAQQTNGEWTNAEMNALSRRDGELRPTWRRASGCSRACCRSASARTPPIIVLHQNATFTAAPQGHSLARLALLLPRFLLAQLEVRLTPAGANRRTASGALLRWLLAYGTFSVPQAAGPIAFALLALPLTGNPGSGAAIVLATTIAQVIGAVPVARLGRRSNAVAFVIS